MGSDRALADEAPVSQYGFEFCVEALLRAEGGYTPGLPDDNGGETHWGITKRNYPSLDIKNLSRAEAITIYWRDYWTPTGCGFLEDALAVTVLDSGVNQGARTAVRLLQEVLGVTIDGVVGPETAAAAQRRMGLDLIERYLAIRIERYSQAANWPTWDRSWTGRILRVHRVALALL